jgi:tetratricopeptide (TPR) repeat protein
VGFSPDNRWLITTGGGCRLWETSTWEEGSRIENNSNSGFTFTRDGKVMALSCEVGQVRLINPDTGGEIARLSVPDQTPLGPCFFSSDGSQLGAIGNETGILYVWNLRAIRAGLKGLGLDWKGPDYPPAPPAPAKPLRVEVNMGRLAAPQPALPGFNPDYERAIPHIQQREFDEAIPLLKKALDVNPNLVPALLELGFAYNETRLYDKAIPILEKLINIQPKLAVAHINLGAAYRATGRYDEAIVSFEKAIAIDGRLAFPHFNLGDIYKDRQFYDKAIACFKTVINLDEKHFAAHNALGYCYNAKGLYNEAILCFQKALEINSKYPPALNNLGFAYNVQGFYEQGIPWLKTAVNIQPKGAIEWSNLGKDLGEIGDLKEACHALNKALLLTPERTPEFKTRKQTLERMQSLLLLEPRLADIVTGKLKPKDSHEGLHFGRLCRIKQHYKAAIRLYDQAYKIDPDAAGKQPPTNLVRHACVAVLAAAGQGRDSLPEGARPTYRAKALIELRKLLKTQQTALEQDFNSNQYICQRSVRVLLQHKDLASVRAPALRNLPEVERKEWETLWKDVDTLLDKADALHPNPSAGEKP